MEDSLIDRILRFLKEIGLSVREADLPDPTFLPGMQIQNGTLVVDSVRLLYPGDLLHEAGHLAVMTPEERATSGPDTGADGGAEMAAIGWSWAAAVHLKLEPEVLFHPDGYRGGSAGLIENFQNGRYLGVPILQWLDMTADRKLAAELGIAPYPFMRRWLRE